MVVGICGRFLRRHLDKAILENPDKLGEVIESVFSGFKPFWAETMCRISGVPANSSPHQVIRRKP